MKTITIFGSEPEILIEMLLRIKAKLHKAWSIRAAGESVVVEDDDTENQNEKYLIISMDKNPGFDLKEYVGTPVITVGFNSKASVTVSSVAEEETVFCVQRKIGLLDKMIEPQEYVFDSNFFGREDVLTTIFAFTILLLFLEKDMEDYILKTTPEE